MSDITSVLETNSADLLKVKDHLEAISASVAGNAELAKILSSATTEFNKFFLNYGKPYFSAHKFLKHDSPQSSVYNENINSLNDDLSRLYSMSNTIATLTIRSFNYAAVVAKELITNAQIAASKVLDLNIIGGFLKGKVFVAGDDFTSTKFIDTTFGLNTPQAEILKGGAAMSLTRVGSVQVSSPDNKITVSYISPDNPHVSADKISNPPTPGNLERFYEGKFYAFMGEIEPEGGFLDMQYIVDPSDLVPVGFTHTSAEGQDIQVEHGTTSAEEAYTAALDAGFYAVMPPTEESKILIRQRMLDGNADTYWQCEYVYETPDLLSTPNSAGIIGMGSKGVGPATQGGMYSPGT